MKKATQLLALLLLALIVVSCTSRKRRDEQGLIAKAWHNMNAHFNGYFNANEILEESFLTLEEQHVDNYNRRLALFPFMAVENPSVVNDELDRAIEKVAVVVNLHPYSNWTDDSYLLAGQAQFLKQDYETAEKTFRYLVNEFRPRPKRNRTNNSQAGQEEEGPRGPQGRQTAEQTRRERLRARRDAQKERDRINKQREKERREAAKERDRQRRQRIRDRRRGIRTPRVVQDTSLTQEPETTVPDPEEVINEGPVGMISIFNRTRDLGLDGSEQYGDNPEGYFLRHRPAYQEGRLWLAWTLIKRDKMDQAQLILEDMRNDRGTASDIRSQALAVQAFLYLESNNPTAAIPYLEEAAAQANTRQQRARYWYIVGQLHQELGEPAQAMAAFAEVIDAKPDYELELGAALNVAQNDYLSGSGDAESALRRLEQMRRQDKNQPYESQIYYAMASVSLRANDQAAGMDYLRKALGSNTAGPAQQQEAYRLLGDLNFEAADYLAAKLYYDSTLNVMGRTDDRYPQIEQRRDRLTDIAATLQDIQLKDSLLTLSELSPEERTALAEDILQAQRQARINRTETATDEPGFVAPVSGSSFWAYDSRAVRRGERDFSRVWGDRPLTDNWRRSQSAAFSPDGRDDDVEIHSDGPAIVTEDEVANIFSEVPTTDNERNTMRLQLTEAYFNLGRLYRDRLDDNAKSVEIMEGLNQRYPGSNFEAESWYYLYLGHTDLGNVSRANQYRDNLVEKYPGTNFARAISDPNFVSDANNEELARNQAYDRAYALFEQDQYQQAYDLARGQQAALIGQHPLRAKYALLMAMSTGKIQGREAYVNALRQVVAQYTDTPEQARAREILRILGETGARLPGGQEGSIGGDFKESAEELHYIVLVFQTRDVDLNEVKIAVSEYNQTYHRQDRLRITNVYLGQDNSTPVLVMRRFQNGGKAMEYLRGTELNADEWVNADILGFETFAVSQSNYREILRARSIAGYPAFFDENYR
ncbi:MAG: tetratricopeptide repeat protein [Bacteroidota bacterium]